MSDLAEKDFAPLFGSAREILETWAARRGYRLKHPKVAAIQALALGAASELFDECAPSRPGLSAAALFLRFEGEGGSRLFGDAPGTLPQLTQLVAAETGALLDEVCWDPMPGERAEDDQRSDALEYLGVWRRICFGGNWDEVRERLFADFVGGRRVDACTRMSLRALCQALLTLLRTEDEALQVQAAHTLLRMLKPADAPASGGGGGKLSVNGGEGFRTLAIGGEADSPEGEVAGHDKLDEWAQQQPGTPQRARARAGARARFGSGSGAGDSAKPGEISKMGVATCSPAVAAALPSKPAGVQEFRPRPRPRPRPRSRRRLRSRLRGLGDFHPHPPCGHPLPERERGVKKEFGALPDEGAQTLSPQRARAPARARARFGAAGAAGGFGRALPRGQAPPAGTGEVRFGASRAPPQVS